MRAFFVSIISVVLVGCSTTVESNPTSSGSGGASSTSSGAGGNTTTTGTQSTTSSSGAGGGPYVDCPSAPPANGASCSMAGERCTYGDDPRAQCRDGFLCEGGAWMETPPATGGACVAASQCPGEEPAPKATCTDAQMGEACAFGDGAQCVCASCPPFGPACMPMNPPGWFCRPGPMDPKCPTTIPNAGTSCAVEGQSCNYPGGCGVEASCKGGAWIWQPDPCPA
jgi:hypothetical protein